MGAKVSWLHLSDFHVGMDQYGQRKLFREICSHIKQRIDRGHQPNFVFITGDLANKGLEIEYKEFIDEFLMPMTNMLGQSWSGKLYCIPGNHDVERSRAQFFSPDDVISSSAHVFDPTVSGQIAREQFMMRFENYSDMDLSCTSPRWLESEHGTASDRVNIGNNTVAIVAINTAWLCKDDHDRHNLTPGIELLEKSLENVGTADLTIVLGHHPIDWINDQHAQSMRLILGKHSAIYLCGHLHANDARYDDGGEGSFLAIRSGAAFQGRPEDKPPSVNGLLWGEVDFEEKAVRLEPFHWSSTHREWKLSTEAFPNKHEVQGKWLFSLPGYLAPISLPEPVKAEPTAISAAQENVPPGWALVDIGFLDARSGSEEELPLLQYFDGRPPGWRLAMSPLVPVRGVVERVRSRFIHLDDATKPTVVNILGPGGEGKSTVFLQTIVALIRDYGWVALWRHNDLAKIDHKTIRRLNYKYNKLLIVVDEAHSIAGEFARLVNNFSNIVKKPHFLFCARTIDWRAEVREMGSITSATDYQEIIIRGIDQEDAHLIVASWAQAGRLALGDLQHVPLDTAADALMTASKTLDDHEDDGALFGAMLQLRYGDKLKDRIRSVLYRLNDMGVPGKPIPEAYAMIAAMHAEGLRFLSIPVLAERFGMTVSEFHKM
jgi:predicted phosphodiesterase